MSQDFTFDSITIKITTRLENSHKGNFGKVLVVGGSEGLEGAGILSSEACFFGGDGLVHLNNHPSNDEARLIRNPRIMALGLHQTISNTEH